MFAFFFKAVFDHIWVLKSVDDEVENLLMEARVDVGSGI